MIVGAPGTRIVAPDATGLAERAAGWLLHQVRATRGAAPVCLAGEPVA